jgi:acid phosphatase type 7
MKLGSFPSLVLVAALVCGCSEDEGKKQPSGTTIVSPTSFPYAPSNGCGYEVHVPEVALEVAGHAPIAGTDPDPRHVHVSWAGPVESTFAVIWTTGALDARSALVLYGTDQAAVEQADGPSGEVRAQAGHSMQIGSVLFSNQKKRVHEVHVCGLLPETTYYYKVGGPGAWSSTYDVTTGVPAGTSKPFRFVLSGDSRDEPAIFAQIQERARAEAPDFQVFSGDAVAIGVNQLDWDAFFEATTGSFAAQETLARVPFMAVNGNHENLSLQYIALFAFPQELSPGERAEGEEWYSFDYGNAHFVMLDDSSVTQSTLVAQRDWMKADLAKIDRNQTPWIFVMHHKPTYTCSKHDSELGLRALWQPVFDEFKVDFVLNGHNHNYERSVPIRGFQADGVEGQKAASGPNEVPISESGTLYVVSGGAGAPLYSANTCYHTYRSEKTRNYVVFDIDGRTLKYRALRLDGSVLDEFTYTK